MKATYQAIQQLRLDIARLQQTVAELRAEWTNLTEFGTGQSASEHCVAEARASRRSSSKRCHMLPSTAVYMYGNSYREIVAAEATNLIRVV